MNAIILAAGLGSRLKSYTADRPKAMLEFSNQTLLNRLIKTFRNFGINDITVVTGYKSEKINIPNVNYIKNDFFLETSTLESLICAKEKITRSTIISYSDIIFEDSVLKKIIDAKNDISIIADRQWLEFWDKRIGESEMEATESVYFNKENVLLSIGQPIKNIEKANGHFIGLMKIQDDGSRVFLDFAEKQIREHKKSLEINPKLNLNKLRIVDVFQNMINSGEKIEAVLIDNGWLEFDTTMDLELYNKMNDEGTLSQFISLK
jgi:choline kinase